jgi:hypothetical protein
MPRTREEIDAEIDALRNEAEGEMQAVESLQLAVTPLPPGFARRDRLW